MAPGISVRIPHESGELENKRSLQAEIQQLVRQKGPFHTITEQGLYQELEKPTVVDDSDVDDGGDADAETEESIREQLLEARFELQQQIALIQSQLGTLRDALSLSIASHSKFAQGLIPPILKSLAPVGSLETKTIEARPPLEGITTKRLREFSIVTRSQSFRSASNKLANAAERLSREAQNQAKYWNQMAVLRGKGWPISRSSSNQRTLVAHYGSAESVPFYRKKGISALRQNENGDLILSSRTVSHPYKVIWVTVHRNSQVTGQAHYVPQISTTDSSIETVLTQARDALFEEELFNEANKEARLIANIGVKSHSSSIIVEVSSDCSIEIRYATTSRHVSSEKNQDQELAKFVSSALRLALVAEHEHKHRQRTQFPPLPLPRETRPAPEYALLRPVTSLLRHYAIICPFMETMKRYCQAFESMNTRLAFNQETNEQTSAENLGVLRRMITSTITIDLPSGTPLTLKAETLLGPPVFGTQFLQVDYHSECGNVTSAQISHTDKAVAFLEEVLAREVGQLVLKVPLRTGMWQIARQHPLVIEFKRENTAIATLEPACRSGKVVVKWNTTEAGSQQKAEWQGSHSTLFRAEGHEEKVVTLSEAIETWVGVP